MPTLARPLTKRSVEALALGAKPFIAWEGGDGAVKGFGVLVRPTGKRTFVFQYDDAAGRARRLTLGEFGPLTVDQARAQARGLYEVARAARHDPATADPATTAKRVRQRATAALGAPTVAELAASYLANRRAKGKRANTLRQYEGMVRTIIGPKLGPRKVAEVTRRDVAALHAELAPTPYMANRVLTVLRAMFGHAEREEWRAPHTNPGVGVDKYPEAVRAHSLTADEYAALGAALARIGREGFPRAEGAPAPRGDVVDVLTPLQRRTLALFRFLALSGWRESEGRTLQWADVDTARGVAILGTTKTGRSVRPLGAPALAVLAEVRGLPVEGAPSPYVFPGAGGAGVEAHRSNVRPPWARVRKAAGLAIRLHDLRHSFTTVARGLGYGDHVIAGLVGHAVRGGVTSRYGDVPDVLVQRAANEVAAAVAGMLEPTPGRVLTFPGPQRDAVG